MVKFMSNPQKLYVDKNGELIAFARDANPQQKAAYRKYKQDREQRQQQQQQEQYMASNSVNMHTVYDSSANLDDLD